MLCLTYGFRAYRSDKQREYFSMKGERIHCRRERNFGLSLGSARAGLIANLRVRLTRVISSYTDRCAHRNLRITAAQDAHFAPCAALARDLFAAFCRRADPLRKEVSIEPGILLSQRSTTCSIQLGSINP